MAQVEVCPKVELEFLDLIAKSVKKLNIPQNDFVEAYIVSLFGKFLENDVFDDEEPISVRFFKSSRLEDFIKIGDETLFLTGFFPERLLVDKNKDYFMTVGKDSYSNASIILNREGEGEIYHVLSKRFEQYSDLINDVSYDAIINLNDDDFFIVYKKWKSYKNSRALEKLKEFGFEE